MIVSTFIDFINIQNFPFSMAEEDKWKKILRVKEFYSTSFKPELILTLFENWQQTSQNIYSRTDRPGCMLRFGLKHYTLVPAAGLESAEIKVPEILNHFIYDCYRYRIDLRWAESAQKIING